MYGGAQHLSNTVGDRTFSRTEFATAIPLVYLSRFTLGGETDYEADEIAASAGLQPCAILFARDKLGESVALQV